MGPQRTGAEEIRQRLQYKARQFFFLNRTSVFMTLPVWVHLLTCDK